GSCVRQKLPEYMVPAVFVWLESLPRGPSGKIDRKALPAPDSARPALDQDFQSARTATEETLASIWKEALGMEAVGTHDNFFEIGGHSLLATRVVSRIRHAFHIELPLRSLFDSPTVASLAEHIDTVLWTREEYQPLVDSGPNDREELKL